MKLNYSFVPPGSTAPDPVPAGEVWLAVGNRAIHGVYDHHKGDTSAWSTSQLLLDRFEWLLSHVAGHDSCSIVLPSPLYLEAVGAAWVAQRILKLGGLVATDAAVKTIVDAVGENTQGLVKTTDPKGSWPIVIRTIIHEEYGHLSDERILEAGFRALDTTYEILAEGRSLKDVAERLITHTVRAFLAHAELAYRDDLERATRFQVRLPVRLLTDHAPPVPDGFAAPPPDSERWLLADALFVENPACSSLFKELARADRKNSPLGLGFPFLVLSDTEATTAQWHHVLSTDRLSGFHLQGLGSMLERCERQKELAVPASLPPGRRSMGNGLGRYGLGVASPWYDGRGHGFTIIDCPDRSDGGPPCRASLLTPAEILEVVWEYGDPARFMRLCESRVSVLQPATLQLGWEAHWIPGKKMTDLCPLLDPDSRTLDSFMQVFQLRPLAETPTLPAGRSDRLFVLPGNEALWTREFRFDVEPSDLRSFAAIAQEVLVNSTSLATPPGLARSNVVPSTAVFHARVARNAVAIPPGTGPTAQAIFRVSRGEGSGFSFRGTDREIEDAHKVDALDREAHFFSAGRGLVLLSARPHAFNEEGQYFRPDNFILLVSYALCLRIRLEEISQLFRIHRMGAGAISGGKKVVQDRSTLFIFEHEALCRRFTSHGFGQAVFEALARRFSVTESHSGAKERIESLARHVEESRANLYQRIGFVLSMVFAPLGILSGFVPKAGWSTSSALLVIGMFVLLSGILGLTWVVGLLKFRRSQRESLTHRKRS